MSVGVLDAGIAIGWLRGGHRRQPKLNALLNACRAGRSILHLSVVNLAEVVLHTQPDASRSGVDPVALLKAAGVRIHVPDEAVARRVARLSSAFGVSLADGFAAATAQELGARLHTTDRELVRQLRPVRLAVSHY